MNPFKEKLLSGKRVIGTEIDLCDPAVTEMVGMAGFDFLWIDSEHEAMDYETILAHIIAAHSAGTASIVRVPFNEPYLAKRVLEMGPDGIIFPMINSAAELKAAMDACLYPPYGKRGFGPRRAAEYGAVSNLDYIASANDSFCRFVQIESIEAVRNLDEMLKVPFVDGFILGPCDLSGSINHLGELDHPEVLALIDEVAEKCAKANMPLGVAIGDISDQCLQFWYDKGIRFMACGNDISCIVNTTRDQAKRMRKIFG